MLKIFNKFSPRANPADGNYPNGSIKNESVPGAKDGTPLDADWGNDLLGFDEALLAAAGITPSGNPDTALVSDRLNALTKIRINDISLSYDPWKTVAQMQADTTILPVGKKVFWQGYNAESDGGSNWGIVKSGAHTADGGSIFTLADGKYVAANLKGKTVSILKFGARGDGTNDTTFIQATIDFVDGNPKSEALIPQGYDGLFTSITIKSGVTLTATGCTLTTLTADAIKFEARSKFIAYGTRIQFQVNNDNHRLIVASNPAVITNECVVIGFEVFGTGQGRGCDLTGFYHSVFDFTVTNISTQYNRSGDLACYYNDITISATQTDRGLLVSGTLFNGNTINIVRCNIEIFGINMASASGNVINNTWIEGGTNSGIILNGCNGTTIKGGIIEGDALTTGVGVEISNGSVGTTILGTRFGQGFADSLKRVSATASCKATTVISDTECFIAIDGEITSLGLGAATLGIKTTFERGVSTFPFQLPRYTVATLLNPASYPDCQIIVTDEVGGFTTAFSDGTNWRRSTDLAIVS